jgi:toxin ParE1/3/4
MQNQQFRTVRTSMNFNVQLTDSAKHDIDMIVDYIAKNPDNPIAADNFLNKVLKTIDLLSYNPIMYPFCNNARLKKKGYRKMIIDNYVFPYIVKENDEIIIISRVIYAKRDYGKML